jgi:hypothetical protein
MVGYFAPRTNQLIGTQVVSSSSGFSVSTDETRLEAAFAFGVKAAVQLTKCCGGEFSVLTTATTRRMQHQTFTPAPGQTTVTRSEVRSTFAAAQFIGRYALSSKVNLGVGIGPIITFLSGAGYQSDAPAKTNVLGYMYSGTWSLMLSSRLRLDITARDFVYELDFGASGPPPNFRGSPTQHDLLTSVGVTASLGGAR